MTFCIAFRNTNAAFLVADTAVTTEHAQAKDEMSLFEQRQQVEDTAVEERFLKIGAYSNGLLLACAGQLRIAVARIELMLEFAKSMGPHEAVEAIVEFARNSEPPPAGKVDQMLFSYFDPQSGPRLRRWSTETPEELADGEVLSIGSLDTPFKHAAYVLADHLRGAQSHPSNLVALMSAELQCLAAHNNFTEMKVGGAFFGAYVDGRGRPTWQEDTTYILYATPELISKGTAAPLDPEGLVQQAASSLNIVSCFARDNVLVNSSHVRRDLMNIFMNSACSLDPKSWVERWRAELENKERRYESTVYVFIDKAKETLCVVRSASGTPKTKYFVITPMDGAAKLSVATPLLEALVQPARKPYPDAVGMDLNWFGDG